MSEPTPADEHVLDLVGLAAYLRLRTFSLLAAQAAGAPDLDGAQRLARIAGRVVRHQEDLLALGEARGADAVALMSPFDGLLDAFEQRTPASTWWEGLLTGVVGHGVSGDLCRLLARGLSPGGADAVLPALADEEHEDDSATTLVRSAAAADPVLASRLALWGRRVVGESLSLAQELLGRSPALGELARAAARAAGVTDGAGAAVGSSADVTAWVLGELTAEHTRRMDRMGLAA
ncbi:hypothetical protein DNL40_00895 [Xylanimonas oleitrophica]|uniref:Ferritin-like domain-containing protein n=1 Tax=Xylanimonas oleitrophica TaxID=2607479 RepID=A0A2W5WU42_9MICO|nr:ferritin-like fold-containing protein [Xylanimonas oleitrophica]PZR54989.1 hypothetical protein DNL40_00895 [Xylanimonas oleitrophica]